MNSFFPPNKYRALYLTWNSRMTLLNNIAFRPNPESSSGSALAPCSCSQWPVLSPHRSICSVDCSFFLDILSSFGFRTHHSHHLLPVILLILTLLYLYSLPLRFYLAAGRNQCHRNATQLVRCTQSYTTHQTSPRTPVLYTQLPPLHFFVDIY